MRAGKNGFSLVEMLVVIAIISLLVALCLPLFWSARSSAQTAWCQSNIRQLYTAFMNYGTDYAGWFPYTKLPDSDWPAKRDWLGYFAPPRHDANAPEAGTLWPYVGDRGVYLCPADSKKRSVLRGDGLGAGYWTRNPVTTHSYAMYNYEGVTGAPTHLDRYPANRARYPFIVDESAVTIDEGNFQSTWDILASRHRLSREGAGGYDRAGGNILFLDGHIELFLATQVMNAEEGLFQR